MAGNKSFTTSLLDLLNDNDFMKNVTSKLHSGTAQQVDIKYYLSLVEEILDPKGDQVQIRSLSSLSPFPLSSTINELCCQITCEALHTNNARRTMESLFDKLSSFSWDAKAVLTLSAFSAYYAENERLAQIEKSDYSINLAAVLRGPRAGKLDFGALKDLIRVTLKFTKYTVEFANYSIEFAASQTPNNIEASFYQIIFGVIGCSVTSSGMISTSNEFLEQDLSTFSNCVLEKYKSFKKDVEDFKRKNEKQLQPLYKEIKELSRSCSDIAKFMALLFCTDKDSPTVYQGSEKTTVEMEQLQNKNVMLLISDLTLSDEDTLTLTSIYNGDFKSRNYEIMWVPIVDIKDDGQFQTKRSKMPWYSCISIVSKAAAKFIRKWWQFKQQTKVVVLNEKGKVENTDAMPMIRLWGLKALPFTRKRSKELLKELSDNWLKLVVNNMVFQSIEQSWDSKELIFLYDSAEDSEIVGQIRNILSSNTHASFNFKSFNINTNREKFLSRLKNYISWKMQVNKEMPDSLTLKLLELYTSYQNQSELAIVARGSSVIVIISLKDLQKVVSEHEKWIKNVTDSQDFDIQFQAHCKKVTATPSCSQFYIPSTVGNIPKCIKCPKADCGRDMDTVVAFKCCHGEH